MPKRKINQISKKTDADAADSSDSTDNSYNESSSSSSSSTDESVNCQYFEKDVTAIKSTIINHVLDQLNKDQKEALEENIKRGIDLAVDQCNDLVKQFDPLVENKPTMNLWKLGLGSKDVKKYSRKLRKIRRVTPVCIKDIIDAQIDLAEKQKLLSKFDQLQQLEPFTPEYVAFNQEIQSELEILKNSKVSSKRQKELKACEIRIKKILGADKTLKTRILDSPIDDSRKTAIYEKYILLQKTAGDSVTAANLEEWIETVLSTPFTTIVPSKLNSINCIIQLKQEFTKQLSGLENVLEPLLTIFNNRIYNPETASLVIGLVGSPGVGKSSICKVLSQVSGLPYYQISFGGMLDSSIIDGQHPGWVGATCGRFAKGLQQMGCINGILFLDEVDKLGETTHGLQVQYSLLHSTDPTQNDHFVDHYLGSKLPLDLSRTIIICAMNKTTGLDPALLNRMNIIHVPDYTTAQKTKIMMQHLFPLALANTGLKPVDITLPEESCNYIQNIVETAIGKEGGVRGVKMCISTIVDKLHLLLKTSSEERSRLNLTFKLPGKLLREKPIVITREIIDELYKPKNKDSGNTFMYL